MFISVAEFAFLLASFICGSFVYGHLAFADACFSFRDRLIKE